MTPLVSHSKQWHWQCSMSTLWNFCVRGTSQTNRRERGKMSELHYLLPKLSLVGMSMMYNNIDVHTSDFCSQIKKNNLVPKQQHLGLDIFFVSRGCFLFPLTLWPKAPGISLAVIRTLAKSEAPASYLFRWFRHPSWLYLGYTMGPGNTIMTNDHYWKKDMIIEEFSG